MPQDLLRRQYAEITNRMEKLLPAVEEVARLESASAALNKISGTTTKAPTTRRKRGAKPTVGSKRGKRKAGRPAGSGQHQEELLTIVRAAKGGIDANNAAKKMDIRVDYLYRIFSSLEARKLVQTDGKVYKAIWSNAAL